MLYSSLKRPMVFIDEEGIHPMGESLRRCAKCLRGLNIELKRNMNQFNPVEPLNLGITYYDCCKPCVLCTTVKSNHLPYQVI